MAIVSCKIDSHELKQLNEWSAEKEQWYATVQNKNVVRVITDYTKRVKTHQSIKGIKKWMKEDPEKATVAVDAIIRNTYRTLMTRGQKGCYVYCTDAALAAYLKERLQKVYSARQDVETLLVAETGEGYRS
ncbi:DNA/RNA helicase domain-containing protein [Kurthia huakuii]|uniref:DNA/RNA helicase domain-containing protein n=1 Tax=Kurthia huakuii TaxID=1421019 RepID=UPI002E116E3F